MGALHFALLVLGMIVVLAKEQLDPMKSADNILAVSGDHYGPSAGAPLATGQESAFDLQVARAVLDKAIPRSMRTDIRFMGTHSKESPDEEIGGFNQSKQKKVLVSGEDLAQHAGKNEVSLDALDTSENALLEVENRKPNLRIKSKSKKALSKIKDKVRGKSKRTKKVIPKMPKIDLTVNIMDNNDNLILQEEGIVNLSTIPSNMSLDCMACKFVWKSVEHQLGNSRSPEAIDTVFRETCSQASKTAIFEPGCSRMGDDLYGFVRDYLNGYTSVSKMCSTAKMCRRGTNKANKNAPNE